MSQKNIKNYFSKSNPDKEILSSDSDSDDNYQNIYYQQKPRSEKNSKNCCEHGVSECWGVLWGTLLLAPKKECFEEENLKLKAFSKTTSTSNLLNHLRSVHDKNLKSIN
ncbi:hypothetical protein CVS40_12907 [Lucilia cuprina]|nr:hypothetical protein CVS40_12907 [Lucilia cuprina]